MFDDEFFAELMPEHMDCLMEIQVLKERAKKKSDGTLVDYIVKRPEAVDIDREADMALSRFFNSGKVSEKDRITLEYCYVLLENTLCVGLDGQLYSTISK